MNATAARIPEDRYSRRFFCLRAIGGAHAARTARSPFAESRTVTIYLSY